MLKSSLCSLLLFASIGYAGAANEMRQASLVIPTGKSYVIPKGITSISFDELTLEENSALIIPPLVSHFTVSSKKSTFGKNTYIVGKGQNGRSNEDGTSGMDLTLILGHASIEGLNVNVQGGKGGNGVPGRNGNDGVDASCKTMRPGGDGVPGEQGTIGKNGGNGGTITVYLSKKSGPINLNFMVQGGAGGAGGPGGIGGEGGEGQGKCGLWPYQTDLEPGNKAGPGATGREGKYGVSGSHTIQFD